LRQQLQSLGSLNTRLRHRRALERAQERRYSIYGSLTASRETNVLLTARCLASGGLRQPDNLFIAFLTSHDFHLRCRYLERPRHRGDPHFRCCAWSRTRAHSSGRPFSSSGRPAVKAPSMFSRRRWLVRPVWWQVSGLRSKTLRSNRSPASEGSASREIVTRGAPQMRQSEETMVRKDFRQPGGATAKR
jgi:hypothetical protein